MELKDKIEQNEIALEVLFEEADQCPIGPLVAKIERLASVLEYLEDEPERNDDMTSACLAKLTALEDEAAALRPKSIDGALFQLALICERAEAIRGEHFHSGAELNQDGIWIEQIKTMAVSLFRLLEPFAPGMASNPLLSGYVGSAAMPPSIGEFPGASAPSPPRAAPL
jgi:hypothetical protein